MYIFCNDQKQLFETQELRLLYESQCHKLEQENCKLRDAAEETHQLCKVGLIH